MKETVDFSKLVSDAINGDNAAFEELYQLTFKTAYHEASLLLGNPSDVEDVLQNSYIKASEKLPELKNPESFESWIKSIVINECKNYIKKEKRISAPIIFLKNKAEEHSEEWKQPVPQEFMEREELRKSVADILDRLSPETRACIVLFHYEDKSLNEISEILDIPLGTVKSRLHNGRKQIEKEFNKLRKKDPTLYSIGAIPVILSLLSFQAESTAIPTAISEAVVSASAAAGAAASSAGSATASTAATGSVAATSIAVKVAAVAVAGSVAVGGSVAIKNHVQNKPEETTTVYSASVESGENSYVVSTSAVTEEVGTTAPLITEASTETVTENETSVLSSTVSATEKTSSQTTTQKQTTTRKRTTTQKQTTAASTRKPSTTKAETKTTEEVKTTADETTKATTTAKQTTTKKVTTTKAETTSPPTTSPENNYAASGGVITEYTGSEQRVSIPSKIGSNTVTSIGAGAFAGNTSIKSVSLPSAVTQIGQEAFADCTSLSSVSLPSSLELIGIGAFYGCSSLTSVSIPDGTKTIGDEAFAQCTALKTVTIPSSVESIADDAFDGCDSLTIRCEEGSAAHDFAVANSINYSLI